jgi:C1A family cysteine protease
MFRLILAFVIAAIVSARLYTEYEPAQKFMWEEFKRDHNKAYETMEEEVERFGHFLNNLRLADSRNEKERENNGTATHGITRFSDMSQEEFVQKFLASKIEPSGARVADVPNYKVNGSSKDWTGIYTTPVKNQAQCGSCWAFSATEQIESDTMRELDETFILSPQQLVSCTPFPSMGCNGGWTENAYKYVMKAGGIEQDKDYPYTSSTGKTGTCTAENQKFVVTVDEYYTVNGENNMGQYVLGTGPLSVCLDANNWNTYTGGVMKVCGNQVDHCVQAVGVDTSSNGYWKVRNSWGTSWGESGFIRLAYGQNTCDITNDPTYTKVSKV